MNLDLQKSFIGLMDLFSMLRDRYVALGGAQAMTTCLFANISSAIWSFCSAPGWMSSTTGPACYTHTTLLTRGGRWPPWLARVLIWLEFERDVAVYRLANFP